MASGTCRSHLFQSRLTTEQQRNIKGSQGRTRLDRDESRAKRPGFGTAQPAVTRAATELIKFFNGYGLVNWPNRSERQEAGIMMIVVSVLVFMGALVAAVATIAMMIAPQWRRILHLATGHVEPAFTPLATLVVAERRIAVRRWAASSPVPSPLARRRVAA
ncbi:hypothetical protein [Sphingomonas sp. Marseille-Q8236]